MKTTEGFKTISHKVDLCVVGGGLAGLCAAVAAARHGTGIPFCFRNAMPNTTDNRIDGVFAEMIFG